MRTEMNNRIALAQGWMIDKDWLVEFTPLTCPNIYWFNPKGKRALRPDYVGSLRGVDGMMRELNETTAETVAPYYDWSLRWSALFQIWDFYGEDEATGERRVQFQSTKEEGSGVAVGKAYVSVFGKEAADVSE